MKRREIAGLAGTAAWPIVARAQHMGMRVIGYLNASSPTINPGSWVAFCGGLSENGLAFGSRVECGHR
jgi:hypothetical protein